MYLLRPGFHPDDEYPSLGGLQIRSAQHGVNVLQAFRNSRRRAYSERIDIAISDPGHEGCVELIGRDF
jgi:hypothetical protein